MLHQVDDYDDDWVSEELPEVFCQLGPEAINHLSDYLTKSDNTTYARATASHALEKISQAYPEEKPKCIHAITTALQHYKHNDLTLNGLLISALIDLNAKDAIEVIRTAFKEEYVDLQVCGDIEDVEMELGLRNERSTLARSFFDPELFKLPGTDFAFSSPIIRDQPKIGRNDSCPCGSGKKYKKCCIA